MRQKKSSKEIWSQAYNKYSWCKRKLNRSESRVLALTKELEEERARNKADTERYINEILTLDRQLGNYERTIERVMPHIRPLDRG